MMNKSVFCGEGRQGCQFEDSLSLQKCEANIVLSVQGFILIVLYHFTISDAIMFCNNYIDQTIRKKQHCEMISQSETLIYCERLN